MSTPPWGQDPEPPTHPPPPPPQGPAQPPYQPYGAPPPPYGSFPQTQQTNGLSIASLVVSIGSVVLCCGLPGIAGAIMGHVARKQAREQGQAGDGMALAGIIVGWLGFAFGLAAVVFYVVGIVILGVWADSVDSVDCYYDSGGNYVCD